MLNKRLFYAKKVAKRNCELEDILQVLKIEHSRALEELGKHQASNFKLKNLDDSLQNDVKVRVSRTENWIIEKNHLSSIS